MHEEHQVIIDEVAERRWLILDHAQARAAGRTWHRADAVVNIHGIETMLHRDSNQAMYMKRPDRPSHMPYFSPRRIDRGT